MPVMNQEADGVGAVDFTGPVQRSDAIAEEGINSIAIFEAEAG